MAEHLKMPIIYHLPSVLLVAFVFIFIGLSLIAFFMGLKRRKKYSLGLILLGAAAVIPVIYLTNILLFKFQFSLAKPYIEQALTQCEAVENIEVKENKFGLASVYVWNSPDENILCNYNNVRWLCDCNAK